MHHVYSHEIKGSSSQDASTDKEESTESTWDGTTIMHGLPNIQIIVLTFGFG